MTYTVHVGPRAEEWPTQIDETSTRGQAQNAAMQALRSAPKDSKAQVRLHSLLLDVYVQPTSGTTRMRHVYEARQRGNGAQS
jgi:hypothetical protein